MAKSESETRANAAEAGRAASERLREEVALMADRLAAAENAALTAVNALESVSVARAEADVAKDLAEQRASEAERREEEAKALLAAEMSGLRERLASAERQLQEESTAAKAAAKKIQDDVEKRRKAVRDLVKIRVFTETRVQLFRSPDRLDLQNEIDCHFSTIDWGVVFKKFILKTL